MDMPADLKLCVLFVENDSTLISNFKECIQDELKECTPQIDVDLNIARNIADALNSLENKTDGFDVVLMDIMLPRNENDLLELEKCEVQRRQIQSRLLHISVEEKVTELTGDVARIRKELSNIDDIIDTHLDIEGGFNILQKYLSRQKKSRYDKPIIFLSARGQIELKERCMKLANEKCYWMEKPIAEQEIFRKMVSFFGIEIPQDEWITSGVEYL